MHIGYLVSLPSLAKRSWQAAAIAATLTLAILGSYWSYDSMRRGKDWGQWNDIFIEAVVN